MGWLLADDSYLEEAGRKEYTKAHHVAPLETSIEPNPESKTTISWFFVVDMTIRMYDDVAVVTAIGRSTTSENGVACYGSAVSAVHVLEKRGGRWQMAADQET